MPTAPRTKLPTQDRQALLIAAALRLAAERSPAQITTGDLAQAVGISQGAVFKHFVSKEALWLAALDWVAGTLIERLSAAASAAPAERPLAALQAVFMAHVAFVAEHPGVPRLIFQELQHAHATPLKAGVQALMQRYRQLVAQLLAQAQAQRLLAPTVDVAAASVLFMGAVQGLVMQSLVSDRLHDLAAHAPGVLALYLRGIAREEPAV